MRNKLKFLVITIGIFLFSFAPKALAANVNLYFFYGQGCPHCAKEEVWLSQMEKQNPNLKVSRFEVWSNQSNQALLEKVANALGIKVAGVPVTVVGNQSIIGYFDDQSTGQQIKQLIDNYRVGVDRDVVGEIISDAKNLNPIEPSLQQNQGQVISSIFGRFDLKSMSLPLLTIVIGLLDSLNPCAMWVLLFLISLMLGMNNRKRMWALGLAFIIGSAAAYFVFLAAWLNIYLFIGYLVWVKVAIVLLALVAGGFNLGEYWRNRKGGCEVSENETKRQFITGKLRMIIDSNKFWWAILGIVALAAGINMVELLCSAGLPAVYIPILTEAKLPQLEYYLYLVLYVVCYILIQLAVFLIAMFTLELKAVSSKVTKWTSLVGGILMLILGFYLIFNWHLLSIG